MGLFEELKNIAQDIENQRHLMKNEEATLQVSIRPFIEALGYDFRNLSEVAPQFTADPRPSGTDRVDYAILRESKPVILIEAKAATVRLTENIWKRLHDYFNAEEVRFGILTNGIEFRFYSDLNKRNIMDRQPFLTIDMQRIDKLLVKELEFFSKSHFDPERILSSAQSIRIRELLAQELRQPSDEFVKHFANQVHAGILSYSDLKRYSEIVQQAWHDLVDQEIASRLQTARESDEPDIEEPTDSSNPKNEDADGGNRRQIDPTASNNQPTLPPVVPRIERPRYAPPKPQTFDDKSTSKQHDGPSGVRVEAKGFYIPKRGREIAVYDPGREQAFYFDGEMLLHQTCYNDMKKDLIVGTKRVKDPTTGKSRSCNVIPDEDRFWFDWERRGSRRYVTRIYKL